MLLSFMFTVSPILANEADGNSKTDFGQSILAQDIGLLGKNAKPSADEQKLQAILDKPVTSRTVKQVIDYNDSSQRNYTPQQLASAYEQVTKNDYLRNNWRLWNAYKDMEREYRAYEGHVPNINQIISVNHNDGRISFGGFVGKALGFMGYSHQDTPMTAQEDFAAALQKEAEIEAAFSK